jgi:dihydroorotase-like cyclic amidohydrolase
MAVKKYPGFIDVHVHLRDPGATHKEDFASGSRAAIAGGFTYVIDMPNNPQPTISINRLKEKINKARETSLCEIGFYFGTNGKNTSSFKKAAAHEAVFGLKIYCNHTTGEMLIEDLADLERIFKAWPVTKPILVHAEGKEMAMAMALAYFYKKRLHVCHVSNQAEVELIRQAKAKGLKVTAGVTPHHLFLTEQDREKLGSLAMMRPPLFSQRDQDALWEAVLDDTIDIVETDHAPHTLEEKKLAEAPNGVPGLETAVSLMFGAVKNKKISEDLLIKLLHDRPKKIFSIPDQADTYVELDLDKTEVVGANGYAGKSTWSPFDGWELPSVQKVVINGSEINV